MHEFMRVKLIQLQLKTEIQDLLLKKNWTRRSLALEEGSPLKGTTRQYVAAVVSAHICSIKAAEDLRNWLASLPEKEGQT